MSAAQAILNRSSATSTSVEEHRPSYGVAVCVTLAVLLLYVLTLSPSTAMWDTGEYMAAARDLGLPHPPGNPLFVLLGHTIGLLPFPSAYAARINLLAALSSSIASGFWFLITERILASWLAERWQRITGGIVASLLGATAFTVWNQSVVNEKVYTVSLAFFAVVSWLMVRWADDPDGPSADRVLIVVGYLLGLGYANHPAGLLTAPAVVVVVAARRPWKFIQADVVGWGTAVLYGLIAVIGLAALTVVFGWIAPAGVLAVAAIAWMQSKSFRRFPLVFAVAGALGLGLSVFAYEPIRSAQFPNMNEGETTGCLTHIEWSCTMSKTTLKRLRDNINREQYGKKLERGASYSAQVGMWWLYFKWQWLRDPAGHHAGLQRLLALVFLVLGLLGGYTHWRSDRRSFWFFGPLVFTMTLALIYYLNFKYGFSQAPELGNSVAREVRDRDYFYIWSFSAWGVWAGLGLVFVWQSLAQMFGPAARIRRDLAPGIPVGSRKGALLTVPVLALALIPLISNWQVASHRGDTFTRDWAHDLLNSVEPYGILITSGDNDTFPLWYAQEVEGIRKDVLVMVTTYLNIDWALRQMIRRPIPTYDAANGPALYRAQQWQKPTTPPLNMSLTDANAVPSYIELREPQAFEHGDIKTVITPRFMPEEQIVMLRLIKDSYPARPIYFAYRGTADEINLGDYVVGHGLAYKLMPHKVTASPTVVQASGEFIDVPASAELWTKVYQGPKTLLRQNKYWADRSTLSIPTRYVINGTLLAQGLAQLGDSTTAALVAETTQKISAVTDLPNLFGR
jgi:hypothetical protein